MSARLPAAVFFDTDVLPSTRKQQCFDRATDSWRLPMLSRLCKSGDSMVVRIPEALAFPPGTLDVDIQRSGEMLVIRPARNVSLAGVSKAFAAFPPGFMAQGRDLRDQKKRRG